MGLGADKGGGGCVCFLLFFWFLRKRKQEKHEIRNMFCVFFLMVNFMFLLIRL